MINEKEKTKKQLIAEIQELHNCVLKLETLIDEQKSAEEALKDSDEKWRVLTENSDDIIIIMDSKYIIKFINKPVPPYTPEEMIGMRVYDYIPKERYDIMETSLIRAFGTIRTDNYETSSVVPKVGPCGLEL